MEISVLSQYVAVLTIISASAERMAEFAKNLLGIAFKCLNEVQTDEQKEAARKLLILLISLISCFLSAWLVLGNVPEGLLPKDPKNLPIKWNFWAVGFLAIGGSSFWNGVQGYLNGAKNSLQIANQASSPILKKQLEAEQKRAKAAELVAEGGDPAEIAKLQAEAKRLDEEATTLINALGKK